MSYWMHDTIEVSSCPAKQTHLGMVQRQIRMDDLQHCLWSWASIHHAGQEKRPRFRAWNETASYMLLGRQPDRGA